MFKYIVYIFLFIVACMIVGWIPMIIAALCGIGYGILYNHSTAFSEWADNFCKEKDETEIDFDALQESLDKAHKEHQEKFIKDYYKKKKEMEAKNGTHK